MTAAGDRDGAPGSGHGALMDAVYRRQKHVYDATRKYFLLGRDAVIEELDPPPGGTVLEIGCGTGRNLALAARRWPQARLHGVDISREMLGVTRARLAREGLADRVRVAEADAQTLDARALFGVEGFDRVFFSYTLSMVPDWRAALACALAALEPEGRLHVVDFGQQAGLPAAFRAALGAWLGLFHVRPDPGLADGFRAAAEAAGRPVTHRAPYRDYCWLLTAGPVDPARRAAG